MVAGAFTSCRRSAAPRVKSCGCLEIVTSSWSAPQWSSDSSRLYVSVAEGGENVVHVLSLPSLEHSRILLPQHLGNFVWDLALRPDSGRFAYVEGSGGATEATRLWTIRTI